MKISVIIPAYNSVAALSRSIESVLAQSYKPDEIIVVDDGSNDATSEVAKMYDEVNLLRQKHMGFASACNNGVMMATNGWIAFLRPEDTWHPDKLQKQADYHRKHRSTRGSCTAAVRAGESYLFESPEITFEACLDDATPALSSLLIEKKLFDRLHGFDETMTDGVAYDFWLRLLIEGTLTCIGGEAYVYVAADDPIPDSDTGLQKEKIQALEKHLDTSADRAVRERLLQTYTALAEATKGRDEAAYARCLARLDQLHSGY